MKSTNRNIPSTLRRIHTHVKTQRLTGAKLLLATTGIITAAVALNCLAILWLGDLRISWFIAGLAIIATAIPFLRATTKATTIQAIIRVPWNNPYLLFWLTTFILIPTLVSIPTAFLHKHQTANATNFHDARPWREGLTATVWWRHPPTPEMEHGLIDAANTLGITYQRAHSQADANLLIWLDSWDLHCKSLNAQAFVSLDPQPHPCGSETAEIHICRFTTPFKDRQLSDRSIIAHESGHVFAALPHFGHGFMDAGAGDYAHWFTDDDLNKMRAHINSFRASVKDNCQEPPPS